MREMQDENATFDTTKAKLELHPGDVEKVPDESKEKQRHVEEKAPINTYEVLDGPGADQSNEERPENLYASPDKRGPRKVDEVKVPVYAEPQATGEQHYASLNKDTRAKPEEGETSETNPTEVKLDVGAVEEQENAYVTLSDDGGPQTNAEEKARDSVA